VYHLNPQKEIGPTAFNTDNHGLQAQCKKEQQIKSMQTGRQNWALFLNTRFMLLSVNLAWTRLRIDRDLLLMVTSTADELSRNANIDDLERPRNQITVFNDFFCDFELRRLLKQYISPEITGNRPRQPAHKLLSIRRRF